MTTTLEGHGLVLGPQDPDNTSGLTAKLGVHNKADKLLERHRANWPVQLTQALGRPVDEERSEALDLDEVQEALESLRGRRAFFNPETDVLEHARVRGTSDRDRVVSVVFRRGGESGRSANGVIGYEGLTRSQRAYEQLLAESKGGGAASAAPASGAPDEELVRRAEEAEKGRDEAERQAQSMAERLRELEDRLGKLEDPEPFEGYDALNANDRAARVKEGGLQEFGRAGLERMRTYEEGKQQPSKRVLEAIDDALASANPAE